MQIQTLVAWGATLSLLFAIGAAGSENTSGPEIVVGNVLAPSADGYSAASNRVASAYFAMVNSTGGIHGRQVRFVSYDSKGDLRRTLDFTRRLVEKDKATLLYQMDPIAQGNRPYVAFKRIPQIFDARPAAKSGTSGIPARLQGKALGKAINELMPDATIAVLYSEDDFSNGVLTGLYDGLGQENARLKIKHRDEVSDASNSLVKMAPGKADVLVVVGDLELQRKVLSQFSAVSWRPIAFMTDAAVFLDREELEIPGAVVSVESRMMRDGVSEREKLDWESFRKRNLSEDANSNAAFDGYLQVRALVTLLELCGNDQKCLIDRYNNSSSRWIAQTITLEQGAWKSIGPLGLTVL